MVGRSLVAVVAVLSLHAEGCTSGGGHGHAAGAGHPDPDAATEAGAAVVPVVASSGCNGVATAAGTSTGELDHDGISRSYELHVPPGYDGKAPVPLVVMLHGGGGSGRQFEQRSSRMDPIADREGFLSVYPDGTGALRTWNGGGCCGAAVLNDVDDVGFIGALLDRLEATLCVDRSRVYAAGMSNGAILSHRLACELSGRLAAVAPVAGTDMIASCTPARPIAHLEIHGTADGHVPWDGGEGCGPTRVDFTPVPETMERWRTRNHCTASTSVTFEQGDGRCETYAGCEGGADVTLCSVQGGGHNWPGGDPPADLVDCPVNGFQSTTFAASEVVWDFFRKHPRLP